jgi:hypothetical protein
VKPSFRRFARLAGFATLCAASAVAGAAEPGRAPLETGWSVRAGISRSDNVTRDAFTKTAETTPEAGFTWFLDDERERFTTRIAADVTWREFTAGTSPNQFDGGALVDLTGVIIPDSFDWVLTDNYGQALINQRQMDSPQNRQNFNFASTGPNITFPLGARTDLRLSGRYSLATYEEELNDNTSVSGTLALARRLSGAQVGSVVISQRRVDFDDPLVARRYDVQDAFLQWEREGLRTAADVSVGYSKLKTAGDSTGGLLVRAVFTRRLSTRSQVGLTVGSEFANSAETFRVNQIFAGGTRTTATVPTTVDAFRSNYVYVSWSTAGTRVDMRLTGTYRKEAHQELVIEDVVRTGGEFAIGRRLSPRLRVGARALYEKRTFDIGGGDGSNWQFGGDLTFALTRTIGSELGYDRFTGEGSGLQRRFVENRVFLRFTYAPRRR